MLTLNLTSGTTTASTAVTFTQGINTNENLSISNNNQVNVLTPGVYEIIGEAILTSTGAVSTGLAIYGNGTQQGNNCAFTASASAITDCIPIYAVVNVKAATSGTAAITVMPVGAPTIVSGLISVKRIS